MKCGKCKHYQKVGKRSGECLYNYLYVINKAGEYKKRRLKVMKSDKPLNSKCFERKLNEM